jgi:hypothetical protein
MSFKQLDVSIKTYWLHKFYMHIVLRFKKTADAT